MSPSGRCDFTTFSCFFSHRVTCIRSVDAFFVSYIIFLDVHVDYSHKKIAECTSNDLNGNDDAWELSDSKYGVTSRVNDNACFRQVGH